MNGKTVIICFVSVSFFTLAATYRFHDSAHVMGMLKKGGGMVRHPPLLDKDRNTYMLIATAGVVPPYQGNARVVLEGDPTLTATFHNSEPAVNLGIYRHPTFQDNTYHDLHPKDRITLWVRIKRKPLANQQQTTVVEQQNQPKHGILPQCTQCEPEAVDSAAPKTSIKKAYAGQTVGSELKMNDSEKGAGQAVAWQDKGQGTASDSGGKWRVKKAGSMPAKGPALAFYDVATNEPLLRIPIKFTGGAGGSSDVH